MKRNWQCEKCHQLNSSQDYMCSGCRALKPVALRLDYDDVYRSIKSPHPWQIKSKHRHRPKAHGLSPDDGNEDEIDEEQAAADKRRQEKKKAKKQTLRQKLSALFARKDGR